MFHAPSQAGLPGLATLLDAIPATPTQIARHLGIAESTLQRYRQQDRAPRAVMLALFWESRWGRQWAYAEAEYAATLHAGLARALEAKNRRLIEQIGRLEQELTLVTARGGAANLPLWQVG